MKINPVKAFKDNYIWVLEAGLQAIVVDPGEATGVMSYLVDKKKDLAAILLTHNHDDHTGGVEQILATYPDTPVYGPEETKALNDHVLDEVKTLRQEDLPTLPSTIGREKDINLLLQAETLERFIELRKARDNF